MRRDLLTLNPVLPRLLLGALVGVLVIGACSYNSGAPAPEVPEPLDTHFGSTLWWKTDRDGHSLYYRDADVGVTGICFDKSTVPADWRVFGYEPYPATSGHYGERATCDQQRILTYQGRPLYRYVPGGTPEAPKSATGDGRDGFYLACPVYGVNLARGRVVVGSAGQMAEMTYLTDGDGRALYTFSLDSLRADTVVASCRGNCQTSWPAYRPSTPVYVSAPLRNADFGLFEPGPPLAYRPNEQLTYRGKPLYTHAHDAPGNTRAHLMVEYGGRWLLAVP